MSDVEPVAEFNHAPTVKDLIEALQKLDQDTPIHINDIEYGPNELYRIVKKTIKDTVLITENGKARVHKKEHTAYVLI